jgi:hypothetical protein
MPKKKKDPRERGPNGVGPCFAIVEKSGLVDRENYLRQELPSRVGGNANARLVS